MLHLRALPSQMTFLNPSSRYYRLTWLHVRSFDWLNLSRLCRSTRLQCLSIDSIDRLDGFQGLLWKAGFGKLMSNGVRNCKSVTRFYCQHWTNDSREFHVWHESAHSVSQNLSHIGGGGFVSSCLVSYTCDKELFCHRLVTGDKTWIYHWDSLSKLEFTQWKDVDCPTFTQIWNLAINWLDYGNSFSGIQTNCLWQSG